MIKSKNPKDYYSEKIKTESEIVKVVNKLKKDSKKIGLCVGGYDLLHPGHMKHFSSAKSFCDVLIVAITTDEFNSKRKGTGRPIYEEWLRAYSVSQLESVDFVFLSYYPSAVDIIKTIKPHYYIKGPDYVKKQTLGIISEREAIAAIGGEMRYTFDEKLSTSEIIEYIKREIR